MTVVIEDAARRKDHGSPKRLAPFYTLGRLVCQSVAGSYIRAIPSRLLLERRSFPFRRVSLPSP
jgi:hypothetical protein